MFLKMMTCLIAITVTAFSAHAAEPLSPITLNPEGTGFISATTGKSFTPWGFNYDHDIDGRLLEDYWLENWDTVAEDFHEMKALGANVVRIHLQFGRFMESPTQPRTHSLAQLSRLVQLAEETGLYLNLTGLGCYHKADVPPWYDGLTEQDRWQAQATFWQAIAKTCANSPAIFCYDLMNEPVVAGGSKPREDWLGPGFGDKHFVQFITLDAAGRARHEIARNWIRQLVAAIRAHDEAHLVTVGLVPWSLPRKGLTSGFVPAEIASELDFLSVHIYPEAGKVDEALETLAGFTAIGKPVVIEETFPLKCSVEEFQQFLRRAQDQAQGVIGFYWGRPLEEYRPPKSIPEAMMLGWLETFQTHAPRKAGGFSSVDCEGSYRHHLQGICTDNEQAIFWSFTTTLVKTDQNGKVLKTIEVANHHGDLCYHDGRIYVAVNFGNFNDPEGNADSWVYVYDPQDLALLEKHEVQQVVYGAGGIGVRDGHFFVVGGLPPTIDENYAYEFDENWKFVKRHTIASGNTLMGIQTATFAEGRWWFGCYGKPAELLVTTPDFKLISRHEYNCALGIVGVGESQLLSANGRCSASTGCTGSATLVETVGDAALQPVATSRTKTP